MDELIVREVERDEVWFAARMTNIQFDALAARLDSRAVMPELATFLPSIRRRKRNADECAELSKWLINGWSTEQLLLTNSEHLAGDALRHSLHWAFPQAYYSVFAITLAAFKARGYTETSHTAVIRKFGLESQTGRYPSVVACTVTGAHDRQFANVACVRNERTLEFRADDPEMIESRLAQFLGATRDIDLVEKKGAIHLKTKRGKRKRAFTPADWEVVSDSLGPTSLLSLLYRKRIKANYRDIDSFLSEELEPERLYRNLLRVVGAMNCVHEAIIGQLLGVEILATTMDRMPASAASRPRTRLDHIGPLLTG